MSPEVWESAWKPDQLMRLPAELIEQYPRRCPAVPLEIWFSARCGIRHPSVAFRADAWELESLGEHEWDDLADRLLLGAIDVDGGPSFVCAISKSAGTITAIDFDSGLPEMFVNSDLAGFGLAMRSVFAMFEAIKDGAEPPQNLPDEIANAILGVDPAALDSDTCFWTGVIEFQRYLAGR